MQLASARVRGQLLRRRSRSVAAPIRTLRPRHQAATRFRQSALPHPLVPRTILIRAAAIAALLLAPHFDFVPMWDGWAYALCATDVVTYRFAVSALRCAGHPAYIYSAVLGGAQLLDLGNPGLLVLVNGAVLAIATLGFHRLMRRAFPEEGHETDIALLTAAVLLQPPFLASVIQPALDLPILAGTIWCTVLLVERRWFWCAAAGTAMAFSKETGVLLFAVLVACYAVWALARTPGTFSARVRTLIPLAPTVLPLVAFAGYVLAFRILRPDRHALWQTASGPPLLENLLVPRLDAEVASFLAMLFVLNFAWFLATLVAVDGAVGVVRFARRRSARVVAGADRPVIGFLTLAAVATIIALTRFTTFSNVRYVMAGTALLLPLAYVALVRLGLTPGARRIALGAYTALLAVSALRTVDPVSRQLWGTFRFGSHRMLHMTSITGECCGAGRDQLVYSLEFTRFNDLTDSVVATLMRDTATVIALPSRMDYHVIGRVDGSTWRRTLRRTGAFEAKVVDGPWLVARAAAPQSLVYIALPNAQDAVTLSMLSDRYVVGPERRFEAGGYALSAYELRLRGSSSP